VHTFKSRDLLRTWATLSPRNAPVTVQPHPLKDRLEDQRINDRYHVRAVLGQGGMACVYRALDILTGQDVALKLLMPRSEPDQRAESIAIFEREFHTLAELRHPCVIKVHDYGVTDSGPYYTMELLDGGDLRERAPLPWREACRVFFDVCSSLALLHSRRLIHRDISPRNVRCTPDGSAKLIDFGAMLPMGPTHQVVGTPAFVAPEVVQGLGLDGRADLFSVGATLYYSLTGQPPSQARDFSQVLAMSQIKAVAPSRCVADIPPALDTLVLALIDPEPALRPRTAFEVMQRLAAIAGLERSEPISVSQAYLCAPVLVGRGQVQSKLRDRIARSVRGRGSAVLIEAQAGLGRTRMLDGCTLEAQTLGATVLHARAATAREGDFSTVRALIEQLLATMPEQLIAAARAENRAFEALFDDGGQPEAQPQRPRLKSWTDLSLTRSALHATLSWFILRATLHRPLVITVDDIHALDASSAALLAVLTHKTRHRRLLLVLTVQNAAACNAPAAVEIIRERSRRLQLHALRDDETAALVGSVFGDVPHIALLANRIHAIAAGNPAESMELAHYLVDQQIIRYEGGNWTLPSRLMVADLPASAADAWQARLRGLSALARKLVETQALALRDGFTRDNYLALAGSIPADQVDTALTELVSQRVLDSDGRVYAFAHQAWSKVLSEALSSSERLDRHRELAEYCLRADKPAPHAVHHLLCAGADEVALDRMVEHLDAIGEEIDLTTFVTNQTSPSQIASIFARCLVIAQTLQRPPRQEFLIRRWMTAISVLTEDEYYLRAAPAWRARLERDSGLTQWRELGAIQDSGERLMRALQGSAERYTAAAEADRVYRPDEAIKLLVSYVSFSIAIGARRLDAALLDSLPELLEPFAPLSPMVHAIWQTSIATRESLCACQVERARARWLDAYARLENATGDELRYAELIRDALAYAIGSSEAGLGLQSAARWANVLDEDPLQAVNAMYLRKVVRLQQGDFEGAERFRRKAELLAVQAEAVQMFTTTLATELIVHAVAGDLTGVRQLADRIAPLAERCPSWSAYQHLAEGYFERLRGNPIAALEAFDRCLELTTPSEQQPYVLFAWPRAIAGKTEALIDLGRHEEARALAQAAVERCKGFGIGILAGDIVRTLALAEAKLGDYTRAAERLDAGIANALELGISGLNLGILYEARTRVALWASDRTAVERYARLTAREYRHGRGSPLGARYERLIEEANNLASPLLPALGALDPQAHAAMGGAGTQSELEVVEAMAGAEQSEGRAPRALRLLCEMHGVTAGHLYLAGKNGLRLAASYGTTPPDRDLLTIAQDRLSQDLSDTGVTRVAGDTSTTRLTHDSGLCWTDPLGQPYEARLLSCVVEGVASCAGVAILKKSTARRRVNRLLQFTTALSVYLLVSGEAQRLD
jgi:tetratricopeptide (TPR) repeat protein